MTTAPPPAAPPPPTPPPSGAPLPAGMPPARAAVPSAAPPAPEPYRLLFPLGLAFALAGALLWPLAAPGWIPYPGTLHSVLMIQGFQQSFVLGFLLTAIRAFTKGGPTRAVETWTAAAAMAAFGVCAAAGWAAAAQLAFLVSVGVALVAYSRRLPRRAGEPPEEVLLVLFGLMLGVLAGAVQLAAATGWLVEPSPRLGLRMVSLGMTLSLVLGVGSFIVPNFTGMPGASLAGSTAPPGLRGARRALFVLLGSALGLAFIAEARGAAAAAAWIRAAAAAAAILLGGRLYRLPGRRDRFTYTLWSGAWAVVAGLWITALLPSRPTLGLHVTFLGGFGLLTAGIASRVVVVHGGHPAGSERALLTPAVLLALGLALAARLGAEFTARGAAHLHATSGALWSLAWALWGWRALPRILVRAGADAAHPPAAPPGGRPSACSRRLHAPKAEPRRP